MADKTNMLLTDVIVDSKARKYLYLDDSIEELVEKLNSLKLENFGDDSMVPFTAKIRGYTGATDHEGSPWLLKDIPSEEASVHKFQEIAERFLQNSLSHIETIDFEHFLIEKGREFRNYINKILIKDV